MGFKVLHWKTRKETNGFYNDEKPEYYATNVKDMEIKYEVSFGKIKEVIMGDIEQPWTEIHFEDGLVLYDEKTCPRWMKLENIKKIATWLK